MTDTTNVESGPTRCAECTRPIKGVRFCPHCGQNVNVGPLNLRVMASTFFAMLTGLEFPLLRTTIDLVWRPGVVAEAWIQGKRRTYASPIKFCLIAGVVITLVLPILNAQPIAPGRPLGPSKSSSRAPPPTTSRSLQWWS